MGNSVPEALKGVQVQWGLAGSTPPEAPYRDISESWAPQALRSGIPTRTAGMTIQGYTKQDMCECVVTVSRVSDRHPTQQFVGNSSSD